MTDLIERVRTGLVWVEGGRFEPGNYTIALRLADGTVERREIGTQPARAVEPVDLAGFYIQSLLPTNADYRLFREATGLPDLTNLGEDDAVAEMPFHEAEAFCAWLGEAADLPLRLPTENEWEYAARSRVLSPPFGTDDGEWVPGRNVWDAPDDAGLFAALPVPGTLPPSPLGLYDLHGVLYQWVSGHAPDDPDDYRIAKGSAALETGWTSPIPSRFSVPPTTRDALEALPHRAPLFPDGAEAIHIASATARCVADIAEPPEESGIGQRPEEIVAPSEEPVFRAVE